MDPSRTYVDRLPGGGWAIFNPDGSRYDAACHRSRKEAELARQMEITDSQDGLAYPTEEERDAGEFPKGFGG